MASTSTSSTSAPVRFRYPRPADGAALWALARENGLDENSPYAYLLWTEYFRDTTVVAATGDDDVPVGFVMAFLRPDDPDTVFVWQIGVAGTHRRQGIAGRILDELVARVRTSHLESTVTPTNSASETLFRRFGDRHGAAVSTEELFPEELFPPGHEAEIRFRIGPMSHD